MRKSERKGKRSARERMERREREEDKNAEQKKIANGKWETVAVVEGFRNVCERKEES